MKSFMVLICVLVAGMAQRPGYLGSGPIGYPGLASRFKDDNATSTPTSSPNINNRLGENGGTTAKIPVDARGDAGLVERLNQWPRENRPFWILNADHIEAHRGQNQNTVQDAQFQSRNNFDQFGNPTETQTIRPLLTRGSFAGLSLQ